MGSLANQSHMMSGCSHVLGSHLIYHSWLMDKGLMDCISNFGPSSQALKAAGAL
jgi:hypothetical protein